MAWLLVHWSSWPLASRSTWCGVDETPSCSITGFNLVILVHRTYTSLKCQKCFRLSHHVLPGGDGLHVVPGHWGRCGGGERLVQTSAPWERRRPSEGCGVEDWMLFEGHAVAELVPCALIGALGQPGPQRCGCTVLLGQYGLSSPARGCPTGSMTKDLHNPTTVALQRFCKQREGPCAWVAQRAEQFLRTTCATPTPNVRGTGTFFLGLSGLAEDGFQRQGK